MKKIIIIDGGPRKNMNTAKLLQQFAEGAKSAGNDVEVKTSMKVWHHKTMHKKFRYGIPLIMAIQIGLSIYFITKAGVVPAFE